MKLDSNLTPFTRIKSRWIKDLNLSHYIIKVLEDNIGRQISAIQCSNVFTSIFPRVKEIKEKNKQMELHQIKMFLHS